MRNQMATSEIREYFHARFLGSGNYQDLDKTRVKLLPNFTSIPFDYLLVSWMANYVSNREFLTCLS